MQNHNKLGRNKCQEQRSKSSTPLPEISEIVAVGGTESARDMITKNGFEHFQAGTISGIPATLLNEGSLMGFDVIVLLVKTYADGLDFRAAALLSQTVTKIIPGIYCNIETMVREGEEIEDNIKAGEEIEDNIKAIRHNLNKISPYR